MFGNRRIKQVGMALLLSGACACSQQKAKGIDFDSAGFDGFTETHFDLLSTDCSYNGSGDMTLTVVGSETAYIFHRTADNKTVANANSVGVECTVGATNRILINGDAGDNKVIIDYYYGTFNLGTTAIPPIAIDLGAGTGDAVKIRGTTGNDLVTLGTKSGTSYFSINTVGGTARTFADMSIAGVESIVVSTGAGGDTITGQGGAAVGGTTAVPVGPIDGAIFLTLYGGDGNDTITSGGASTGGAYNMLYGGAGNDYFPQATALAADRIFGGADTDTVDYSNRTNAVRVTLGGTTPAKSATGSIACAAKANIADNDSFTIAADATHSKTFAYNKSGSGTAATGSITCPAKAAFADNDFFVVSDGSHAKRFYYQTTGAAKAQIQTVVKGSLDTPNDYFTLGDGTHSDVVFEYDTAGGGSPAHGGHMVDIHTATNLADVATLTASAITAQHDATLFPLGAEATADGIVHLTADTIGTGGNSFHISKTVTNAGFTVTAWAGGAAFTATAGNASPAIPININASITANDVAVATFTVVNTAYGVGTFAVAATSPGATAVIALANHSVGTTGNVLIDATGVTATGFSVTGMSGGVNLFVESAANTTANAVIIDISSGLITSANDVCVATFNSVSTVHPTFAVTATNPLGTMVMPLTNDATGAAGNQAIVLSSGVSFTAIGMAQGAAAITNDDGDIAGAEGDNIDATVENVIGSSKDDIIDARNSDITHVLMGMAGNDTLYGSPTAMSYLYGGVGNDTLYGGTGADVLVGGNDDDTLQGGPGDDSINGGGINCFAATSTATPVVPYVNTVVCTTTVAGANATTPGSDTIDYSDRTVNTQNLYVDLTNLVNCTTHKMGEVSLSECDSIVLFGTGAAAVASVKNIRGGAGKDTLIGDARDNIIWGGANDDTIMGGLGNDSLYGEAGNDIIDGCDGTNTALTAAQITAGVTDNDYINGGLGTNTLKGDDGLDTIDSSLGTTDSVDCGLGDGDINLFASGGSLGTSCEL